MRDELMEVLALLYVSQRGARVLNLLNQRHDRRDKDQLQA